MHSHGMWVDAINAMMSHVKEWWIHVYAWSTAFCVALLRSLLSGHALIRSLAEAMLCGALTLVVFPIIEYFGVSTSLAVAFGGTVAFLGVDWFRGFLMDFAERVANSGSFLQ